MEQEKIIINIVNNSPQTRRAVILGGKALPAPDSKPTTLFQFDIQLIITLADRVTVFLSIYNGNPPPNEFDTYQTATLSSPITTGEQLLYLLNALEKGIFYLSGNIIYSYSSVYDYRSIII